MTDRAREPFSSLIVFATAAPVDRTAPAEAVALGHDLVWDPPWPGRAWWRCRVCTARARRVWGVLFGDALDGPCAGEPPWDGPGGIAMRWRPGDSVFVSSSGAGRL